METKLIRLQTNPIIDYAGIEGISELIDKRIKAFNIDNQLATTDTVKSLKTMRATLNKEFEEYEKQRKAVKTAISKPYAEFEERYKVLISSKYQQADSALREKIYSVEDALKEAKTNAIMAYFDEYCQSKKIDFVKFSQANINVTLSASEKSLKEQAARFVDDIDKDLQAIDIIPQEEDFKTEVLVEYKTSLDVVSAIENVTNRRKQKEEALKQKNATIEPSPSITPQPDAVPDIPLSAPVVEEAPKTYQVVFQVVGTIEQLKALKQFMVNNNISFNNINK